MSDTERFDASPSIKEHLLSSPLYCVEDEVATGATGLSGGAGPSGVDGTHLKTGSYGIK